MNSKILIIHNPKAGQKKKTKLKNDLQRWSKNELQFVPSYDYIETEYAGHASKITKKAIVDGYTCVVAAGGDGTVNEIASVLVNTDVTLGIIPMGSGNGLARHNNIPLDLEIAFYNLYSGKPTKIDSGVINGKHYFCASGIGFDALVSEKFANSKTRGLISYFLISLQEYFKYKSKTYQIEFDNKSLSRKAFFITFANANQFGNHAFIAPQAVIDDGKLEICILSPFKWFQGFKLAKMLFNKTIEKSNLYEAHQSDNIKISSKSNIPFHFDGDIMKNDSKHIEITVIHKALNIIIP